VIDALCGANGSGGESSEEQVEPNRHPGLSLKSVKFQWQRRRDVDGIAGSCEGEAWSLYGNFGMSRPICPQLTRSGELCSRTERRARSAQLLSRGEGIHSRAVSLDMMRNEDRFRKCACPAPRESAVGGRTMSVRPAAPLQEPEVLRGFKNRARSRSETRSCVSA